MDRACLESSAVAVAAVTSADRSGVGWDLAGFPSQAVAQAVARESVEEESPVRFRAVVGVLAAVGGSMESLD